MIICQLCSHDYKKPSVGSVLIKFGVAVSNIDYKMNSSFLLSFLVISISVAVIKAGYTVVPYILTLGFDTNGADCRGTIVLKIRDSGRDLLSAHKIITNTKDLKHVNLRLPFNGPNRPDFTDIQLVQLQAAKYVDLVFYPVDANNDGCKKPIKIHYVGFTHPDTRKTTMFSLGEPSTNFPSGDNFPSEFPSELLTPNEWILLTRYGSEPGPKEEWKPEEPIILEDD